MILKKYNFLIFSSLLFLLIFVFINFFLFEKLIPIISNGDLNYLGLLEGDAIIFHKQAIFLSNMMKNGNFIVFENFLYFNEIPLNIKILSFFYTVFHQDPIVVIYMNALFFSISIIFIYKVSLLFFDKHSYSKIFFIAVSLLLLLSPSFIYSFNSSGKESIVITLFILFFYYFLKIYKNYSISIWNLIIIIISFTMLYFLKPHFSMMMFIHTILTIILMMFNLNKNKKKIFEFSKLFFSFTIIYFLFSIVGENFNTTFDILILQNPVIDFQSKDHILPLISSTNLIDYIFNIAFDLRNHFIDHNIGINPNSNFLDIHTISKFFIYAPKLLIESILLPYPFKLITENYDLFVTLINFEMIILYLLLSSIVINIRKISNYEIYIILFTFTCCFIIYFVNPNIGTLVRTRQPFILLLILLGIKNWLHLLKYFYQKFLIYNVINLSNSFIYKIFTHSFSNIILILLFTLLILCREFFFIKLIGINNDLSVYLLTITFLSILSNSFNTPLADILVTNKRINKTMLSQDSFNTIISLSTIIILLVILFIYNSNNFFLFFGIDYHIDFYFIFIFSIFLISIPFNALFTSFLNFINKSIIVFSFQLIVPICSLLFIILFYDNLKLTHIYLSVGIGIFLNSFSLLIAAKYNKFNFINYFNYSFNFFNFYSLKKLLLLFLSLFLLNSFILISIYYVEISNSSDFSIINIGFRFILLISAVISAIITSMILPLINENNNFSKNILLKLFIIIFAFILLAIVFIFLLFDNFIFFLTDDINSNVIINIHSILTSIFRFIPLFVMVGLLLKYFTLLNKINIFLKVTILYLLIYIFILQYFNAISNIVFISSTLAIIYFFYILTLIYFTNLSLKFRFIITLITFISASSNFL